MAPELVVQAKPPEKDLDFTVAFHPVPTVQKVNEMTSRYTQDYCLRNFYCRSPHRLKIRFRFRMAVGSSP
ncbi:hypothetical protein [Bradyrhizobium valentinum]|uniref:hypothetical protein n=1 Tax=Bradyrhizobium valentinum TaxID=1518501 RepID=UPI000A9521BB|nr:hypothetical protein [Bradyrhizobium valentinum]